MTCDVDVDEDAAIIELVPLFPVGLATLAEDEAFPVVLFSTADAPLSIELDMTITTPFGQARRHVALGEPVEPQALTEVWLPRAALADLDRVFPSSGVIGFTIRGVAADGREVVSSPSGRMYFHPEGELAVVYDVVARDAAFHRGQLDVAVVEALAVDADPDTEVALSFESELVGTRSDEEEP